jgi:hypothetical protein
MRLFWFARIFAITLPFLWCLSFMAQIPQVPSNKGDLDGAISFGPAFPISVHRNGQAAPLVPTQFATNAYGMRAEANAGFGNGWKFGLGLMLYRSNADADALSSFLEGYIARSNYFMTKEMDENPSYSSQIWFVQLENEINRGAIRIAPHFHCGIANFVALFQSSYNLKEKGTNYEMDVTVSPYPGAWPGFAYGAGMKLGYSPGGPEGKFFLFANVDYIRYRMGTLLEFRTEDVFDSVTYNQQFYSATIGYYGVMLGGAYYLR